MSVKITIANAKGVAGRWMRQYRNSDGRWTRTITGDTERIYNSLCELGPNPDVDAVAEVIGNKSWSHIICDNCGEHFPVCVEVSFCDSGSVRAYCKSCASQIGKAAEMLP